MMATDTNTIGEALAYGAHSDEGKRHTLEDRHAVVSFQTADGMPATLALVADGIGGQSTGEMASELAKHTIPEVVQAQSPAASEVGRALAAAFKEANRRIYEASLEREDRAGMGTTATAVVIIGKRLYSAHVGDSRAYLQRGKSLVQLTTDHSWAEEALRAGRSPEEIRVHPNRNVIKRFLGIDPTVVVDTSYRTGPEGETADSATAPLFLEPGDVILLCSDGVSDALDPRRVSRLLRSKAPQPASEALVEAALKAGATDNVTAVVLALPDGKKRPGVPLWLWAVIGLIVLLAAAGLIALAANGRATAPIADATASAAPGTPQPTSTPMASAGLINDVGGIATATLANRATGDQASAGPTLEPTPTLLPPTPTAEARATLRPTRSRVGTSTAPASATAATQAGRPASEMRVTLVEPADRTESSGGLTFRWQPSRDLAANETFEVAFWKEGEGPQSAIGPVGQTATSPLDISQGAFEAVLPQSGNYWWGVFLWTGNQRRLVSERRLFIYQRPLQEVVPTQSLPQTPPAEE